MDCIVFALFALQCALGGPGTAPESTPEPREPVIRMIDLTAPEGSVGRPTGSGLALERLAFPPERAGDLRPARAARAPVRRSERFDSGLAPERRLPALATSIDLETGESAPSSETEPIPPRPRRDHVELRAGPLWSSSSRNRIDRMTLTELELGRRITDHASATLQIDYLFGDDTENGVDIEVRAAQLMVGGTGRFEAWIAEIYAGGAIGLAYGRYRLDFGGFRVKDDAWLGALNLRGGVRLNLAPQLVIGAEGRFNLSTNAEIQGEKVNMNGFGVLVSLGLRF